MHSAALSALILVMAPSNVLADTVTLKNGDIISGTIRDITQTQGLHVQATFGQNMLIPWENVSDMRNAKGVSLPIFAPYRQPQSEVYVAQPLTTSQTQRFTQTQKVISNAVTTYSLDDGAPTNITAPALTQNIQPVRAVAPAIEEIVQNIDTTPLASTPDIGWLGAVWNGRATAGLTNQSGNTDSEAYNLDAGAQARWGERHRAGISAEYDFEEESDVTTEDQRQLDLGYDYFYSKKWFSNIQANFEQDEIANLDLRSKYGLGIGYQPFESDELNLKIVAGPSYITQDFTDGSTEEDAAAGWDFDYDQRVWGDAVQIFHNHDVDFPIDDTNAYLLETETGVRMPIKGGIIASAQFEYDRDNEPALGAEDDDAKYSINLGYEW